MSSRQSEPDQIRARPDVPAIPLQLCHLPVIGGLAVPWVVTRHADGTPVLGFVDAARQAACITRGWCQVCGKLLGPRLVLLARARDVVVGHVVEPGLHPECAAYSAAACPMLAGSMVKYRSAPRPARQERCADPSCGCRAWHRPGDRSQRAGQLREPFAAVWIRAAAYRAEVGSVGPVISLRRIPVLRVRPVPPSPPDAWAMLAADTPRDSVWPPEVALFAALDLAALTRSGPAG